MRTSTIPHHNAVLAILCRADGTLIEVLHDEFGIARRTGSGVGLAGLVDAADAQKAARFLRTAAANRPALDIPLLVPLPTGPAALFFTAAMGARGIVILGAREPIARSRPAEAPEEFGPTRILEIAAHDLRNPVSGILAASEYLIEDVKGGLEEHHLSLLRSIQSSSQLILRRLDEMLAAPSIEESQEETSLRLQPTDLASLVERSAEANRPFAENRNIRIELKSRRAIPRLDLDAHKMLQAINALLRNEIRCSRPGSSIEVVLDAPGAEATITVRDQGPGISASHLRNLFDPFRVGRPKRGLIEARTSLALATVKRIVEEHRGTILVESEMRKGSSFTLRLPLSSPAAATSGTRKRAAKRFNA